MASCQKQSQKKDDEEDDERFFREYSKALAEALLENERGSKAVPKDQQVQDAYVALCHDEPRVNSDEACRLLASSLTNRNKTGSNDSVYALSERLVEGIRQATSRTEQPVPSKTTADHHNVDQQDEQQKQEGQTSTTLNSVATATADGYALLAAAAFVQIPLACCQCSEKDGIESYLGSYRGPPRQQGTDGDLEFSKPPADTRDINSYNGVGNDHDSLEEIFAEDSDPDDFEYESGLDGLYPPGAWDVPEMDPSILSRPPPTIETTWTDLRNAVSNLLSELTYSKLANLSPQKWNSLRLQDLLVQLTLTLLVPTTTSDNSRKLSLLDDEEDPACVKLRGLGVQPLFCLRDRALETSKQGNDEALNEYLMLLQTLLGVDAVIQNFQQKQNQHPLAPASVIGLTSLSALCDAQDGSQSVRSNIRKCVMENVEDLASIVERASTSTSLSPTKDSKQNEEDEINDKVPTWVHLTLSLLPLIHSITHVQADGSAQHSTNKTMFTASNGEAQILLNSGLFRELILLYTRNHKEASSTGVYARTQLLRAVLVLCIQSPTIFAKYAWRVPELSRLLSGPLQDKSQLPSLDCRIIWSLLGGFVLSSSGGGGRLRVKTASTNKNSINSTTARIPTIELCQRDAIDSFEKLCLAVIQALNDLSTMRQKKPSTDNKQESPSGSWKQQHIDTVTEFTRFTNLLVSCSSLANMWVNYIQGGDGSENVTSYGKSVKQHLENIRTAASAIPAVPKSHAKELLDRKDALPLKTSENDKTPNPIVGVTDTNDEHVASVMRGLKVLSLLLQEDVPQQGRNLSSKTD